jgi:hypothetical protein
MSGESLTQVHGFLNKKTSLTLSNFRRMKPLLFISFLAVFVLAIFHVGQWFDNPHPSLNNHALDPDLHLINVKRYLKDKANDRSAIELGKAIESIRILEEDMDEASAFRLEVAIAGLVHAYQHITENQHDPIEFNWAVIRILNMLTLAELRVSEHYAEVNKLPQAKSALRFGLLHLKNALNFTTGELRDRESGIMAEMSRLLSEFDHDPIATTLRIDELIEDLEALLIEI